MAVIAIELGTAYVSVVPSATGITGNLSKLLGGPAAAAGQVAGKQAGQGMAQGVGASSAGIGASLKKNAVLPLLGVGVAAFASAKSVESAYNTIRAGTGKTGKELAGLEGSFRNVAKSTPADLGLVATAIADVNKRLGLVGQPLEDVSLRLVRLSRLTGTDLKTNVAAMTRVFGDWSIPTEKQAVALDKIYRASQQTGIGVDQLSQSVVQFGSPLRQMGFSFEQSLALFGRFEKEGVNTSTVLSGLKMGLKNFAKAGRDPQKALQETILQIKGAGSAAEANAAAFKIFGARAGPDMAAAIREGRFDLDKLTTSITNGKDSIANAAKDTSTLTGKFGVLKNQATLALSSLGGPILEGFTSLVTAAMPALAGFGEAFGSLPGPVKAATSALIAFAVLRGPLGKMVTSFASIGKAGVAGVKGIGKAATGAASGLGRLAGGFRNANVAQSAFSGKLGTLGGKLRTIVSSVGTGAKALGTWTKNVATAGRASLVAAAGIVKQTAATVAAKTAQLAAAAASKVWAAAQWLLNAALSANPIGLIVAGIAALVAGFVVAYQKVGWFRTAVDAVWGAIKTVAGWIIDNWPIALAVLTGGLGIAVLFIVKNWDTIVNVVKTAIGFVWNIIQTVVGAIVAFWKAEWDAISAVVSFVWGVITGAIDGAINIVKGVIETGMGIVRGVWDTAWNGLTSVVESVTGTIKSLWNGVIGVLKSAWNGIASAWNSTIGQLSIHVPDWVPGIGGNGFDMPNLPRLWTGGIVPGSTQGTPVIAGDRNVAEAIIPLPKLEALSGGSGRPIEIHNHFGEKITDRDLRAAEAATRRGVLAGLRAL